MKSQLPVNMITRLVPCAYKDHSTLYQDCALTSEVPKRFKGPTKAYPRHERLNEYGKSDLKISLLHYKRGGSLGIAGRRDTPETRARGSGREFVPSNLGRARSFHNELHYKRGGSLGIAGRRDTPEPRARGSGWEFVLSNLGCARSFHSELHYERGGSKVARHPKPRGPGFRVPEERPRTRPLPACPVSTFDMCVRHDRLCSTPRADVSRGVVDRAIQATVVLGLCYPSLRRGVCLRSQSNP